MRSTTRTAARAACALLVSAAIAAAAPRAGAIVGGTDQVERRLRRAARVHRDRVADRRRGMLGDADLADRRDDRGALRVRDERRAGCSASRDPPPSSCASGRSTSPIRRSAAPPASSRCCRSRTTAGTARATSTTSRCSRSTARCPRRPPARRAAPGPGKSLLIAGYGQHLQQRHGAFRALRAGADHGRRPCLVPAHSETFDPSWLFCGAAAADPAVRAARPATATRAGPRSRTRTRSRTWSSRASSATGRGPSCQGRARTSCSSRASAASSTARSPPRRRLGHACGTTRRARPSGRSSQAHRPRRHPHAAHRRRPQQALARRHRLLHTRGPRRRRAIRGVPDQPLGALQPQRQGRRFSGYVCAQGTDGTSKPRTAPAPPSASADGRHFEVLSTVRPSAAPWKCASSRISSAMSRLAL